MCDEAIDDSLAALKPIPYWFVTSKMIKQHYTALYADDVLLSFNEDATLCCNEMGILIVNLNNINLDNDFAFWWRWSWYYYSYQTFGLAQ